jgi:hypothetical protein
MPVLPLPLPLPKLPWPLRHCRPQPLLWHCAIASPVCWEIVIDPPKAVLPSHMIAAINCYSSSACAMIIATGEVADDIKYDGKAAEIVVFEENEEEEVQLTAGNNSSVLLTPNHNDCIRVANNHVAEEEDNDDLFVALLASKILSRGGISLAVPVVSPSSEKIATTIANTTTSTTWLWSKRWTSPVLS